MSQGRFIGGPLLERLGQPLRPIGSHSLLAAFALAALLWLSLGDTASAAAPANDDFANAATLSGLPANVTGSNADATNETGEPVVGRGHSVWWSWTAPSDGDVTVDTCGSELFDTVLAVYTGSNVHNLTPVGSNDYAFDNCGVTDGPAATSKLSFEATGGQVYKIVVDSGPGSGPEETGTIALALYRPPQPANDDFANAAALTENEGEVIWAGPHTNAGASREEGEPIHAGDLGGHSVWFSWTAPRSGVVHFGTCGANGNTLDSLLAVYTGDSVETLNPVASNHDSWCSPVSFRPEAGQTYHIAVDGAAGAMGIFFLTKAPTPPNDDFENATPLSGPSADDYGRNDTATSEPGEPNHAGNAVGHSLWWRWTAPADGSVRVDACGFNWVSPQPDTVLAVYTGAAVDALSPVASNDDGASCVSGSRVAFTASAGQTYQIAVDGAARSNALGIVGLSLRGTAPPAGPAPASPAPSASPASGFNLKAAIKQCKQKHPKGSKKRTRCIKKARKRGL
jgi:hypothetical protein